MRFNIEVTEHICGQSGARGGKVASIIQCPLWVAASYQKGSGTA